jgi:hypothetical protein
MIPLEIAQLVTPSYALAHNNGIKEPLHTVKVTLYTKQIVIIIIIILTL